MKAIFLLVHMTKVCVFSEHSEKKKHQYKQNSQPNQELAISRSPRWFTWKLLDHHGIFQLLSAKDLLILVGQICLWCSSRSKTHAVMESWVFPAFPKIKRYKTLGIYELYQVDHDRISHQGHIMGPTIRLPVDTMIWPLQFRFKNFPEQNVLHLFVEQIQTGWKNLKLWLRGWSVSKATDATSHVNKLRPQQIISFVKTIFNSDIWHLFSSWWFSSHLKNIRQIGSFPPSRDEKKHKLWNHHLASK